MDQNSVKPGSPDDSGNPDGGQTDYSKPVAYDNQGRPLYAHPPQTPAPAAAAPSAAEPSHTYVHVSRPINPDDPNIPPEIMRRYEESVKKYPRLNLSKGEFVISAVKRHPIGIVEIWGVALLLIAALGALLVSFVGSNSEDMLLLGAAGLGLVSFFIFAGALVATYVYTNNRFYLTNESVIQEIQQSIFSKHEQTVSLANIEDASYKKSGILQYALDYGTIRLSTEGDETTYRFSYVAKPKEHIAVLNNAVEAFKNGRPVTLNDDQPN